MSLSHEAVLFFQKRQNDEHMYEIDQSTYTGNLNKSETLKSNMRQTRFKN